jgi:predicted AAA+ superfamily ATPase
LQITWLFSIFVKKLAMDNMIPRQLSALLKRYLKNFKAVAILGPRQCGKSTLAKQIIKAFPDSIYIDLESPADRIKLSEPQLFLTSVAGQIVCIDEIQLMPELFSTLRGIIDQKNLPGQFLILGSASRDLIRQSSETLAGRIIYLELTPFLFEELGLNSDNVLQYVSKGGFPNSYLANDEELSYAWRRSFISSFLERDIAQLGFNYPPETMRRLWTFIAHSQGQMVNLSEFGQLLGISHTTVRKYIDLLSATYMIRVLPPFENNIKKRLAKTPRMYIRDTGILHNLLNIRDLNTLFSHPVFGASWETMVIENILSTIDCDKAGFYRTMNGAEIDLVIERNGIRVGIECKSSLTPTVERGMYTCMEDLQLKEAFVAAPVSSSYFLKENIRVMPIQELLPELKRKLNV